MRTKQEKQAYIEQFREHEAFVDQLRKLHNISKVTPWKIPMWLQKRLTKWCRSRGKPFMRHYGGNLDLVVSAIVGNHHSAWLDHWGTTILKRPGMADEKVFVSEPYFHISEFPNPMKFAEELGIKLRIELMSWHYPGRAIRLSFREPKEKE